MSSSSSASTLSFQVALSTCADSIAASEDRPCRVQATSDVPLPPPPHRATPQQPSKRPRAEDGPLAMHTQEEPRSETVVATEQRHTHSDPKLAVQVSTNRIPLVEGAHHTSHSVATPMTAQMDQMTVWHHVLSFRSAALRVSPSCVASVSPQVRRVGESGASPVPLDDVPVLLWWLRGRRGAVAIVGSISTTDASLVAVQGLPQLQSLTLSCCTLIADAGLAHLQGLTQLQSLNLKWCGLITDAGLAHLLGLTQLQSLDLYRCRSRSAGLAHLQRLKQLQNLVLPSL